jgi:cytoskeletal protein CcmA (bactofilin family)
MTAAWWAFALALVAALATLPMVPAVMACARPRRRDPAGGETPEDPSSRARQFAGKLADALVSRRSNLRGLPLVRAPAHGPWPVDETESLQARSRRVWHGIENLTLPSGMRFHAPVAARASIRTAVGSRCHSLWAGRYLMLSPGSRVLRWAHGVQVHMGEGCHLRGQVTATELITVNGACSFSLLHAPTVRFGMPSAPRASVHIGTWPGLPEAARRDALQARAVCTGRLAVHGYRSWSGDLVCHGDLVIGEGCVAGGSLKARGRLLALGPDCRVEGHVVCDGAVRIGPGCVVAGCVLSERSIVLGADCVIGSPGRPVTVSAPRIEVGQGVVVHGTVSACQRGEARPRPAAAPEAAPSALGGIAALSG